MSSYLLGLLRLVSDSLVVDVLLVPKSNVYEILTIHSFGMLNPFLSLNC